MSWWCSARDVPWEWTWQPYPGVWLFVFVFTGAYFAGLWSARRRLPSDETPIRPWQTASFLVGVLCLWAAADWPIGPLGAGYLVSVHAAQYLVFTLIAPPLLLLGTPAWLARQVIDLGRLQRVLKFLTHPLLALATFNGVLVLTHLPVVVDNFRGTQMGGFGIDMLWLGSGLLMWWVVLGPLPEFNRLHPFWAMGFLFLQSLVPTVPASFLTFADYPLYGLYELAPRVGDISATEDQQLAGLLMKIGGAIILWTAIAVIFFRWYVEDEEAKHEPGADHETNLEPRTLLDAEPELAATSRRL